MAAAEVRIVGVVEVGFRAEKRVGELLEKYPKTFPAPVSRRFPQLKQFAYVYRGPDMTLGDKRLTEGMVVVCVDASNLPPEQGRLFVLRRERGGEVETAVREARVFRDHVEYVADDDVVTAPPESAELVGRVYFIGYLMND